MSTENSHQQLFDIVREIPVEISETQVETILTGISTLPFWKIWLRQVNLGSFGAIIGATAIIIGTVWLSLPQSPESIMELTLEAIENHDPEPMPLSLPVSEEQEPLAKVNSKTSLLSQMPAPLLRTDAIPMPSSLQAIIPEATFIPKAKPGESALPPSKVEVPVEKIPTRAQKTTDWTPELYYPTGEPTIAGKWKGRLEGHLLIFVFDFKERGKGWRSHWNQLNVIPLKDIPDLPKYQRGTYELQREAGVLSISSSKRHQKGTFFFTPDQSFKDYLESIGLDLNEADLNPITFSGSNKVTGSSGPKITKSRQELLHFRFFLANINQEYIGYLRKQGYDASDFKYLWKLADRNTSLPYLKKIFPHLKRLTTEKIPLIDLAFMKDNPTPIEPVSGSPAAVTRLN